MQHNTAKQFKAMPLKSWDIFIENYHETLVEAKIKSEQSQVAKLADKFNWKNDLEQANFGTKKIWTFVFLH